MFNYKWIKIKKAWCLILKKAKLFEIINIIIIIFVTFIIIFIIITYFRISVLKLS